MIFAKKSKAKLGSRANPEWKKFHEVADRDYWIGEWTLLFEESRQREEELKVQLAETQKSLSKMTVERDRLGEQCRRLLLEIHRQEMFR